MNWPSHDETVFTNIDGGMLFGQDVPKARWFQPDTLTFWMRAGPAYEQITHDQAFVQRVYLHYLYGTPVDDWRSSEGLQLLGLDHDYRTTPDAVRAAVLEMPAVLDLIRTIGVSEADVWSYTQAVAPWAF